MASKTFYDYQPPNVDASWLNDVDKAVYHVLGGSQTASDLRTFIHAVQTSDNSINDIRIGTHANRPAAGTANRIYIATDAPQLIYFDTGTQWLSITTDQSNIAITGGSITGITDLAVADGGTGASTASNARSNLGLGTASTHPTGDFATSAQGSLASSSVQPNDNVTVLGSGTATSGYVPQSDGSGNIAWNAVSSASTVAASVAQFTSTNTSININQSTETAIPWDTTLLADPNVTVSGTQVTDGAAGLYKCYVSLAMYSTAQRPVPKIQFRVNGVIQNPASVSGYIRSYNNANYSSSGLELYLNLAAGDVIDVVSKLRGYTGTVTLVANESVLSVDKVGGAPANLASVATSGAYTDLTGTPTPYFELVAGSSPKPSKSAIIGGVPMRKAYTIPSGFTNSYARALTTFTNAASFAVKAYPSGSTTATSIGSVSFAAGATNGTFASASGAYTGAAGDFLTIEAPATQDATGAEIGISIYGTYV